ncbi:uncharacterized protein DSM5745_04397 [Aspergillus mulundensis]|uniref:Uncharacterized protein n=1 Tax=Aspergillus mulundensis TaxID=1810919 RepID=A0A3D8SD29_9EURO|nr:hypothetical protein DSM5745_04397 [Aspergillus mulundensis]RDW84071.1 hypothetical protein DSM5745_04397 [Aspergillus mulundensis]
MRHAEDPYISTADFFLLEKWQENSPLPDDAQREQIFAAFADLGVQGQQPYQEIKQQRGRKASHLTTAERDLLSRVRHPTDRCLDDYFIPWVRTCYESGTDEAWTAIKEKLAGHCGGKTAMALDNAALYNVAREQRRIFYRVPQLLCVSESARQHRERLRKALYGEDSEEEDPDSDSDAQSEIYLDEPDYETYYWALVQGRIHVVDRVALAPEGSCPYAGKVRVVWYDACGRTIKYYRADVGYALELTGCDSYFLFENPVWGSAMVGKEFREGGACAPPFKVERESEGEGSKEEGGNK